MEKIPLVMPRLNVPAPPSISDHPGVRVASLRKETAARRAPSATRPHTANGKIERAAEPASVRKAKGHETGRRTPSVKGERVRGALSAVEMVASSVRTTPHMVTTPLKQLRNAAPSSTLTPYTVAVYGGALVLGMYILKSYKDGGVAVDDSGTKRSVFRWIDAACGVLVAMMLINFARTVV